jgi:hypothetical protein
LAAAMPQKSKPILSASDLMNSVFENSFKAILSMFENKI